MGDRSSISFKNGDTESVSLFSHWGGMEFVQAAQTYADSLKAHAKTGGTSMPLDRLEPQIVMVDFIRHLLGKEDRIESGYYLGRDQNDGDNSDQGHHFIHLD